MTRLQAVQSDGLAAAGVVPFPPEYVPVVCRESPLGIAIRGGKRLIATGAANDMVLRGRERDAIHHGIYSRPVLSIKENTTGHDIAVAGYRRGKTRPTDQAAKGHRGCLRNDQVAVIDVCSCEHIHARAARAHSKDHGPIGAGCAGTGRNGRRARSRRLGKGDILVGHTVPGLVS